MGSRKFSKKYKGGSHQRRISHFAAQDVLHRKLRNVIKCCGTCTHYKRDFKCRLDDSVVVLSTTDPIECRFYRPQVYKSDLGNLRVLDNTY